MNNKLHYLALGDSYTIGEMVSPIDNFPNQLGAALRTKHIDIDVRIIAKTGWTTDELETGIKVAEVASPLREKYDLVTLLIGVNDQYRAQSVETYKPAFEKLLKQAITFAGGNKDRVTVLSIPDWGVTPFAEGRNRAEISREIDAYNLANRVITESYGIRYTDITPWTREAVNDPSLLAGDGLHPSGKEYRRWAELLVESLAVLLGN